jgi:hypothetical protein
MPGQVYQPKDSRSALLLLRVTFFVLLWACALEWIAPSFAPPPFSWSGWPIELILAAVGVIESAVILYIRFVKISELLSSCEGELTGEALRMAFTYYFVCLVCCNAVAVYGLFERLGGISAKRAAPFYVGAIILLLICYPRLPVLPEKGSAPPIEPN